MKNMRIFRIEAAILFLIPALLLFGPQAQARSATRSESSIEELQKRLIHADQACRSGNLSEEERTHAARDGEQAVSLLIARANEAGNNWQRIGVFFHEMGYYRQICDLWANRLPEILNEKTAWHASLGLWYLSSARRYVGDWTGVREALEALDRTAAREGLEENERAACRKVALSERIRYWLAVGEYEQAMAQLPRYEELEKQWPERPEVRLDLVARVHGASGNPRAALEEFDAFLAGGGTLGPALSLMRAGYGLTMAGFEETDPGPWIAALREALSAADVADRERVKAAYDLFGAYVAQENFEGAAWCLADLQRSLAPRSVAQDEGAILEDSSLLATLGTYLAVKTGEDRSVLEEKARDLDGIFTRLFRFRATHPLAEQGSGLARYPKALAIFGTLVEIQTELYGETGAISAIERISAHHTLSALSRRMDLKPCSLAEVRDELLLDAGHGVLLLQRAPKQTGGCRIFAFDRDRLCWDAVWDLENYLKRTRQLMVEFHSRRDLQDQWARLSEEALKELLPAQIRELFDEWRCVTLVGFDGEQWFPFECLNVNGSILGADKAFNHLPSLPFGLHLKRRQADAQRRFDQNLLLVAAPEPSDAARTAYPDLEPLSITEDQIRTLAAPFPSDSVLTLVRDQATLDALVELEGSFQLLHIFAHGTTLDRPEGASAGILLGSRSPEISGVLERKTVADLPGAGAVFLSACSAGRGAIRTMEGGLNNLGGAFLEHGADAVVFSHEDLLVGPTLDLMSRVSEKVAAGSSVAAALTAARQEMLRRGVSDPRLHSTLRVWGLGQRPVFAEAPAGTPDSGGPEKRRGLDTRILLTAAILGGLGLLLWRRRSSR